MSEKKLKPGETWRRKKRAWVKACMEAITSSGQAWRHRMYDY